MENNETALYEAMEDYGKKHGAKKLVNEMCASILLIMRLKKKDSFVCSVYGTGMVAANLSNNNEIKNMDKIKEATNWICNIKK